MRSDWFWTVAVVSNLLGLLGALWVLALMGNEAARDVGVLLVGFNAALAALSWRKR